VETAPYPGLATDLQPPTSVLLTQATARATSTRPSSRTGWSGSASWAEWAPAWQSDRLHHATITGPTRLHGAEVEIGDLRAGASLILAALAADGTSTSGAHHVQRGYENIDRKFHDLGARIERVPEGSTPTP
jgi:UDP-N-acetylglucosamine 1-carboxyvinyltransferase